MRKLARIGATALALALSITIMTPGTAMAATETKEKLARNYENRDYNSLIEENRKNVLGPFDDVFDAYDAAKAKGYRKNGDWIEGYSLHEDLTTKKIYVVYTTYTNTVTGQTSTKSSEVNTRFSSESDESNRFQSAIRIKKGEITYLAIPLHSGDFTIKKVKSSKKSIVSAKLYKKMSSEYTTQDRPSYFSRTNPDGTCSYFYVNSVGDKIVIGTFTNDDAGKAKLKAALDATNGSEAVRYIKLEGKKEGKANLTFKVYNIAGQETGKVKLTVHVQDDVSPFKTVTFAGKSLLTDYSNPNNINYKKKDTDTLWDVSSAKKGKLVVKANKNYKITKIEVGTLYKETKNYEKPYSGSYTTTDHKVDGKTVFFKYKTVKSGKKISLGTTPYYGDSGNYSGDFSGDKSTKTSKNGTRKTNVNGLYAPTAIRITYYDKLTQTYAVESFRIYCKAKK
jgi:hypothetical protein